MFQDGLLPAEGGAAVHGSAAGPHPVALHPAGSAAGLRPHPGVGRAGKPLRSGARLHPGLGRLLLRALPGEWGRAD